MKLTNMKLEDNIIHCLKIDKITMQCAILFETTAEHKSQQQGKLYNMHYVEMHGILRKH